MDISELEPAIKNGDVKKVKELMSHFSLEAKDGKIVPKDIPNAKYNLGFWDQRQQARKILLNVI